MHLDYLYQKWMCERLMLLKLNTHCKLFDYLRIVSMPYNQWSSTWLYVSILLTFVVVCIWYLKYYYYWKFSSILQSISILSASYVLQHCSFTIVGL